MQADKACLFEIILLFGYFIKLWEEYDDRSLAEGMITRLEKRWDSWEQPLLLLALVLHPRFHLTKFNPDLETLNFVFLGSWLIYYYKA